MLEILLETFLESLFILLSLYVIYVVIEIIEQKGDESKLARALQGKRAPILGGALGIVPECGLSVMSAKLYDSGFIRMGTLIAIFLSSSDEGLVVLLSGLTQGVKVVNLLLFIGLKIIFAVGIGYIVNALMRKREIINVGTKTDVCKECNEEHKGFSDKYIFHPLFHALKIYAFVLIVDVAFALLIYYVGEENISNFLSASRWVQPIVCPLVGLIPNCSSSVVISELYVKGGLTFAGLLSGLMANAGLGLTILFKNKKNIKKSLLIVGVLYLSSVAVGYLVSLF